MCCGGGYGVRRRESSGVHPQTKPRTLRNSVFALHSPGKFFFVTRLRLTLDGQAAILFCLPAWTFSVLVEGNTAFSRCANSLLLVRRLVSASAMRSAASHVYCFFFRADFFAGVRGITRFTDLTAFFATRPTTFFSVFATRLISRSMFFQFFLSSAAAD